MTVDCRDVAGWGVGGGGRGGGGGEGQGVDRSTRRVNKNERPFGPDVTRRREN